MSTLVLDEPTIDSTVERPPARRPLPVRLAWRIGIVAGPALVLFVAGYRRRDMSDDGLIFTRAVREIVAGNGPVFSPGERAETSTSALWQWLLALGYWVTRIDPAKLAVYGGLVLAAAGFALALDATCRLRGRDGGVLMPAGVFVLLSVPPVWDYMTSGLESGLATCWLGGCWWLLVTPPSPRRRLAPYAIVLTFGLGPLVRPELVIVSGCFLLAFAVVRRPGWRTLLGYGAVAAALPVAYEVFRMGYYGIAVPMTALAKEAGGANWKQGWAYLTNFADPYWLWTPLALVALATVAVWVGRRRPLGQSAVLAAPLVAGALLTVYVIRLGGDFMHARMLLAPLLLLLLPVLVVPVDRVTVPVAALLACCALLNLSPLRVPYEGGDAYVRNIRLYDMWATHRGKVITGQDWESAAPSLPGIVAARMRMPQTALICCSSDGDYLPLRPDLPYHIVVAASYLGMTGAVVPLDQGIVDMWSLASPIGSHLQLTERGRPGHEKALDPVWIIADLADPRVTLPDPALQRAVTAARHAMSCGQLRELLDSVRQPMSWHRFGANLAGAVRRTELRIPEDPYAAERAFCR